MDLSNALFIAASCAITLIWLAIIRATYQHTRQIEEDHQHNRESLRPHPATEPSRASIVEAETSIGKYVPLKGYEEGKLILVVHVPIPLGEGEISFEAAIEEALRTGTTEADIGMSTVGSESSGPHGLPPASTQSHLNSRADVEPTTSRQWRSSTELLEAIRDLSQAIHDIESSGVSIPNPPTRRSRLHDDLRARHGRRRDRNVQQQPLPLPHPQPRNQSAFGGWYGSVADMVNSRMGFRGL